MRPLLRPLVLSAIFAAWLLGLGWLALQPAPAVLAAEMQTTDSYPAPIEITPLEGYPEPGTPLPTSTASGANGATNTPTPTTTTPLASQTPFPPGQPSPTVGLTTPSPSATEFLTQLPSSTAQRDRYATEDAEMGNSQVTPPPLETFTPTSHALEITPTLVAQPDGFQLNMPLFLIGLLAPLGVFILGIILYKSLNSSEFH